MSAALVAKLTDAIAECQAALGTSDTRKLLLWLAKGLGDTRKQESAGRGLHSPPDPEPA